jgi:LAO/AO transport system kinase
VTGSNELAAKVKAGDRAATARVISLIEAGRAGVESIVAELHSGGGHAHVVGLTGPAGSGKSSLIAALARALLERGRSVGVLAVDPSSSISGGSILGDRIRMSESFSDSRVFFRSMATRGAFGGLARATADAVTVLDASGTDCVLVETVGAGQVDVDIAAASHTTVVVSVPGLGDEIQSIKAGLLELADVHVVNKADLEGANKAVGDLKTMLKMTDTPDGGRKPPVVPVSSTTGDGIEDLIDALDEHRRWLQETNELERRERRMAEARIRAIVYEPVVQRLRDPAKRAELDAAVESVCARELDPFNAARRLIDDTTQRA